MFEVGEEEETWEEVERGHEEPSESGDAPEGGLQRALFRFYPEDPQSLSRLVFTVQQTILFSIMRYVSNKHQGHVRMCHQQNQPLKYLLQLVHLGASSTWHK